MLLEQLCLSWYDLSLAYTRVAITSSCRWLQEAEEQQTSISLEQMDPTHNETTNTTQNGCLGRQTRTAETAELLAD
jgi:hypothetical protein